MTFGTLALALAALVVFVLIPVGGPWRFTTPVKETDTEVVTALAAGDVQRGTWVANLQAAGVAVGMTGVRRCEAVHSRRISTGDTKTGARQRTTISVQITADGKRVYGRGLDSARTGNGQQGDSKTKMDKLACLRSGNSYIAIVELSFVFFRG